MTLVPSNFDRQGVSIASLDELDLVRIEEVMRQRLGARYEAQTLTEHARRMGLLVSVGTSLVPSVAGLLVFGHHPQLFFPQWSVVGVRVNGSTLSDDIASRVDVEGNLEQLVEQAVAFVAEQSHTLGDQVDPSVMNGEYPSRGVREVIVNALLHRDLRSPGRVAVRIFDDRLEVWSPGPLLLSTVDPDSLTREGGVSLPTNVLLASTARMMGIGEQLGRGLPVIRRSVAGLTEAPVTLQVTKTSVKVVIPSSLQLHSGSARQLS